MVQLPAPSHVPVAGTFPVPSCAPCLQTDLTHVNILAELYCEAGQWGPALAICQRAERELLAPDEQLPVDLKARGHGLGCCC